MFGGRFLDAVCSEAQDWCPGMGNEFMKSPIYKESQKRNLGRSLASVNKVIDFSGVRVKPEGKDGFRRDVEDRVKLVDEGKIKFQ